MFYKSVEDKRKYCFNVVDVDGGTGITAPKKHYDLWSLSEDWMVITQSYSK